MPDLQNVFGTHHPVAMVTGSGAPRVGNCVAHRLARRGYRLVIHAHTSTAEAEATAEVLRNETDVLVVEADLRDEAAIEGMFAQVVRKFSRLDSLVNCAAIWQARKLEDVTAEDVRQHFEVNTLGTFLCCQRAGFLMAEQPQGGAIVNVGDWAITRPYPDYAAYFASKGAIPALTRSLAVELAQRNPRIRVNAILPGPAMLPRLMSADERIKVIAATLVKRLGTPEHVADAVRFLLENDFVTGVCLPVDGGRSIYAG